MSSDKELFSQYFEPSKIPELDFQSSSSILPFDIVGLDFGNGKRNQVVSKSSENVKVGNSNPHEYFTQTDFIFWHKTAQSNNQTLVRSYIFHKPSGKLSVKSDNIITSGEKMYFYECAINE